MKFRTQLCIVSCALALSLGRPAGANGRYPQASQLVVDPANPMHWVARATFGILETPDAGQSWAWICEDAIGYFSSEDPAIAVTADGTTLVAWSEGVSASRDGGCSWTRPAGTGFAVDVTVHPSDPHRAIAIVTSLGEGGRVVSLVETSDDGATFHGIGTAISGDFVGSTVEVAPSAEGRIYVGGNVQTRGTDSGQISVQPAVERSDDGGATWTRSILDLPGATAIFIGAVDPQNPDVVYARTYVSGSGVVLMSRDGGATWISIFTATGDLLGLALSRDGTTLAAGGPDIGIHVAETSDLVFRQTSNVGTSCLAWSDHRLLTCAKEALALFSIGVSDDLGAHFTPVMHLSSIEPRACAASTSAGVCTNVWPAVASLIQPDGGGSLEPNGSNPVRDESPPRSCGCTFRRDRGTPLLALLALLSIAGRRALFRTSRAKRGFWHRIIRCPSDKTRLRTAADGERALCDGRYS